MSERHRELTGKVQTRWGGATPNLKRVESLILERTGLPSMTPGTLNVQLPDVYIVRADTQIGPNEYFTGETLKLQRCIVRGCRMWIMRPNTHEPPGEDGDVLELIATFHLRSVWSMQDGDELVVEVEGDDEWWVGPFAPT